MTNCIGAYYLFLFAVSNSLRLKSRNNCQHSSKPIYVTGTGQRALDNEHWITSTGHWTLSFVVFRPDHYYVTLLETSCFVSLCTFFKCLAAVLFMVCRSVGLSLPLGR